MTVAARVLIVDDEAAHTGALCETLQAAGYATTGFTRGADAVEALRKSRYDLLLADLMMPGMDGIALLQSAHALDPDIAGVIMTGEGTIATAVDAMKAGAVDYILKPFKLSIVLPVLSRALDLRRLRMENAELERRVRERSAELEAANKELEAFSFSVSHDLRAPLRAINGFCRMIEEDVDGRLGESGMRLFATVRESAQKMERLIDDLLAFFRTARQPINAQEVDMASLASAAWQDVRAAWPDRQVDFNLPSLPSAWGDPALLKQAWLNLLSNAMKYSGKRERAIIDVSAEDQGSMVTYQVRDNGAGFDMRFAHKLFEVFQRLHSDSEFSGTGVGLAIVQRVVTRHNGRVWAEGKVGAGATFSFSLPKAPGRV
jgi:two-component system sensor histidine kinase/response regulator